MSVARPTPTPLPTIKHLVETNLKGIAEDKLARLGLDNLKELHQRLSERLQETDPPPKPHLPYARNELNLVMCSIFKLKSRIAKLPSEAHKKKETNPNNNDSLERDLRKAKDNSRVSNEKNESLKRKHPVTTSRVNDILAQTNRLGSELAARKSARPAPEHASSPTQHYYKEEDDYHYKDTLHEYPLEKMSADDTYDEYEERGYYPGQ